MAGAVGDIPDAGLVGTAEGQEALCEGQVVDLVAGADVVDRAIHTIGQHQFQGRAIVVHVAPVADVAAVAVERNPPAPQQPGHEQRDDLLRVLEPAVIVGGAGHHDRQPVRRVVRQGNQIGGGLGGRIGRAGGQRVGLAEGTIRDRAVHLVGGHVQQPVDADIQGHLADGRGTDAVGGHEPGGIGDGTVHVALGCEVDHRVVARHGISQGGAVADIGMHEAVAGAPLQTGQVGGVARIREGVVDGDLVTAADGTMDEVGAYEAGTTCHQQAHVSAPRTPGGCRQRAQRRPGWPGHARTGPVLPPPSRHLWPDRPRPPPARRPGRSSRQRDR